MVGAWRLLRWVGCRRVFECRRDIRGHRGCVARRCGRAGEALPPVRSERLRNSPILVGSSPPEIVSEPRRARARRCAAHPRGHEPRRANGTFWITSLPPKLPERAIRHSYSLVLRVLERMVAFVVLGSLGLALTLPLASILGDSGRSLPGTLFMKCCHTRFGRRADITCAKHSRADASEEPPCGGGRGTLSV